MLNTLLVLDIYLSYCSLQTPMSINLIVNHIYQTTIQKPYSIDYGRSSMSC